MHLQTYPMLWRYISCFSSTKKVEILFYSILSLFIEFVLIRISYPITRIKNSAILKLLPRMLSDDQSASSYNVSFQIYRWLHAICIWHRRHDCTWIRRNERYSSEYLHKVIINFNHPCNLKPTEGIINWGFLEVDLGLCISTMYRPIATFFSNDRNEVRKVLNDVWNTIWYLVSASWQSRPIHLPPRNLPVRKVTLLVYYAKSSLLEVKMASKTW